MPSAPSGAAGGRPDRTLARPEPPEKKLKILSHVHPGLLESATARFPDIEVIRVPEEGELPDGVEGEVLLTQAWGSPNLGECVKRGVRWIHTFGTGVNAFPFDQVGDAVLTCARGASAIPISEWVLAVMLAFEKQLPGFA